MIKERLFWTWDHSTNWALHAYGAQNCGVANAYAKAPEMFEVDYRRVIDFCAEHGIAYHIKDGTFTEIDDD